MPEGPWQVLHACLSIAIDDFIGVVGQMQDDVEDAEELVFGQTRGVEIDRPYQIKRELIEFRRCVSPLCNPLTQLATHDFALVPDDARPYFRDLSDLVQEVRENIHTMEDQLTNILQAALALASVNDNRDMRKISAAVAILAVPTTLGAIYGMNFDNIPELHWGIRLLRADGGQRNPHAGALPDLPPDPLAMTTQQGLQSATEAETCND